MIRYTIPLPLPSFVSPPPPLQEDYPRAESMYTRALDTEPDHANAAYNYAVLLDSSMHNTLRAETMYQQVLRTNPTHSFALYNMAVLLEERAHALEAGHAPTSNEWVDEVRSYYQRAVKAAPKG